MTDVVVDTPGELVVGVVSAKDLSIFRFVGVGVGGCMTVTSRRPDDLEISGRLTVLLCTPCGLCAMCVGGGIWRPIHRSKAV